MKCKYLLAIGLFLQISQTVNGQITTNYGSWQDTIRNRVIPYKIYRPTLLTQLSPTIIFSHGLGGSVEASSYLGTFLAAQGYVCFFIQHPGSDENVWKTQKTIDAKGVLKASINDPSNAMNRFGDIPFVIQQLKWMNDNNAEIKGKLNMDAIGMAGHSYGAKSTMVAAGEKIVGVSTKYKVPEIKAGLMLSPNIPDRIRGDLAGYYADITIPLLHITGTDDQDPLNRSKDFNPMQRTQPYQQINKSAQYLLVLQGANHMTFGGGNNRRYFGTQKDSNRYHEAVQQAALAFFDAYLLHKSDREAWLRHSFGKTLLAEDRFEYKTGL